MIDAPEGVLGEIAAKPQIDRLARFEDLLPDVGASTVIAVRDGISDHQQIHLSVAHLSDFFRVPGKPPLFNPGAGVTAGCLASVTGSAA